MTEQGFDDYEAKYEAARRLEADILPGNKVVLFEALNAAGIATVTIEFEGSGDSGQMEPPCARMANETVVAIPDRQIDLKRIDWSLGLIAESLSLLEAVESLAWRLLGDKHCGWENNDGGYGTFTFDVAARAISLEYNERYTETNYHEHEF